jgi:hypothetical protein
MDADARQKLSVVTATADRLDALAETAELMEDVDAAARLRDQAASLRMQGMEMLDD